METEGMFCEKSKAKFIITNFYGNSMFQGFHLPDFMEGIVGAWGLRSPKTPMCNRVKTFSLWNQ